MLRRLAAPRCAATGQRLYKPSLALHRSGASLLSTSTPVHSTRVHTCDVLIAGGGILGVNIAAVLKARAPHLRVTIVDKEADLGLHASGRNSGVGHSGLYYPSDTLKAAFTRDGNAFLASYCGRKGIPVNACGKLIPARHAGDTAGLELLFSRAKANGVPVEEISVAAAQRLEPLLKAHGASVLWSPSTFVADPLAVLRAQVNDALAAGIDIYTGLQVTTLIRKSAAGPGSAAHVEAVARPFDGAPFASAGVGLETRRSPANSSESVTFQAGHFINAAGLHADTLARQLGFGGGLALVPFKGLYLYCTLPLTRLVYPVPDLGKPFLGVHFTVTATGGCKVGPTAIPAFWREHYGDDGTGAFHRAAPAEAAAILALEGAMFAGDASFRRLALVELAKYNKGAMIAGAGELVRGGDEPSAYTHYGRAGIRAQLVQTRAGTVPSLVMDFLLEGDGTSTHVLNAVSPGWTCSRPFAEVVADRALGGRSGSGGEAAAGAPA